MKKVSVTELSRIKIFSTLRPPQLEQLAEHIERSEYHAKETVIHQGDDNTDVMVVLDGSVRATIYAKNGREIAIREIGIGEWFGDYSAIDNNARSTDVVVTVDSVLGVMRAEHFIEISTRLPDVSLLQMRELTSMIRHLTNRVVELSTLTASYRIQAELVRLVRGSSQQENSGVIAHAPTHAELAAAVSTQREVVTRELKRLEDLGFVQRNGGNLVIHNLSALEILSTTGQS